jgi:hypothetical protein
MHLARPARPTHSTAPAQRLSLGLTRFATALMLPLALLAAPAEAKPKLPACQIVYDAGSSGTRLYVYEQQGKSWAEHVGPKVSALADPVREFRGRHWSDHEAVSAEVIQALSDLRHDGPTDDKGEPAWKAFDWSAQCRITSARVLATAGMRLAEQQQRERSQTLWNDLRQRLQAALTQQLGYRVPVEARTLTGYEEGLYAWLAVRQATGREDFGIAEMGGASSQVTFPCPRCTGSDDAVRRVRIGKRMERIYSYSFLGLGQDEAPVVLGVAPSCAYGVGASQAGWQPSDCSRTLALSENHSAATAPGALRDPFNYTLPARAGQPRGTARKIPTERAEVKGWFLTGAFTYFDEKSVDRTCRQRGKHAGDDSVACFRPVYQQTYLDALGIPFSSPRQDASWTMGAVLCAADRCLQAEARKPLLCRWSDRGCL